MSRTNAKPWIAALYAAAIGAARPAAAVSLAVTSPAQPIPAAGLADAPASAVETKAIESWSAGSATLVPMMAADAAAMTVSNPDAPADAAAGAVGRPLDDMAFLRQATEGARREIGAARDALPKLRNPELKRLAEMLVDDHSESNARLSRIAASKGWALPPTQPAQPPAAGTASSSFDARWAADMIAGHERSLALYRAQAQNGEDRELRQYASDTLPIIEHHLAQLRNLQQ